MCCFPYFPSSLFRFVRFTLEPMALLKIWHVWPTVSMSREPLMAGGESKTPPPETIICVPRVVPQWGYRPDEEQVIDDGRVDVCFRLLQSRAAQWGCEPSCRARRSWTPHIPSGGSVYEINPHNRCVPTSFSFVFLLLCLPTHTHLANNNLPSRSFFFCSLYWLQAKGREQTCPGRTPQIKI